MYGLLCKEISRYSRGKAQILPVSTVQQNKPLTRYNRYKVNK